MFKVYVDSDSLPERQRALLLKRLVRDCIPALFAADRPLKDVSSAIACHTAALRAPMRGLADVEELRRIRSPLELVVVEKGNDSADDYLVSAAEPGGLCITHDIPLAARMVGKGLVVIDDRGNVYDRSNIAERLGMRNFMKDMRENGFFEERQKRFTAKDVENFANALDRMIHRLSLNE